MVKADYRDVGDDRMIGKTGKPEAADGKSNEGVAHLAAGHGVPRDRARTPATHDLKTRAG